MVDLHLLFDGAPLIMPIMVGVSGVTVYLVASSIDKIINTTQNIIERRNERYLMEHDNTGPLNHKKKTVYNNKGKRNQMLNKLTPKKSTEKKTVPTNKPLKRVNKK
jgi:hypothetical protein